MRKYSSPPTTCALAALTHEFDLTILRRSVVCCKRLLGSPGETSALPADLGLSLQSISSSIGTDIKSFRSIPVKTISPHLQEVTVVPIVSPYPLKKAEKANLKKRSGIIAKIS